MSRLKSRMQDVYARFVKMSDRGSFEPPGKPKLHHSATIRIALTVCLNQQAAAEGQVRAMT